MGRAGYDDNYGDDNPWALIRYRGAVESAFRGKRGQAFLREMLAALDSLTEKKLITDELSHGGQVCAIGAVGLARGLDMEKVDPYDPYQVAPCFGIATAMAREIVYENDEGFYGRETPEQRFDRMHAWIASRIKTEENNGQP